MNRPSPSPLTKSEVGYLAGVLERAELSIDRNGKAWFTNPVNRQIFVGFNLASGKRLEGWG